MANDVTYLAPGPLEVTRAIGLGLTWAGAVVAVLLGRRLFIDAASAVPLGAIAFLVVGLTMLLVSRSRLKRLWNHNKPYLLSERGAEVLRGRREFSRRLELFARLLLALFVVVTIVFFYLFSLISCSDRIIGNCVDPDAPPESVLVAVLLASISLGAAWGVTAYSRRRYDDETERLDVLVAEGQRHRRRDHPMAGSERFAWE
jgi:hypothetical protein